MQIVSIFFVLCILVFVSVFLYMPFLEGRARRVTEAEHEASTLLAERERVVNSLQELEFDYSLGKVPEEDYPTQRANLLQKGADVLRKLDELVPAKVQSDKDARIERAIAARRKNSAMKKDGPTTDDDIESMISLRRSGRKEKTGGFCPKCGKAVLISDKFCPSCGKTLS
ncbi:MAG: zinc ribbon domain-containing protein [Chloroflexota bacterium]